jgi:predicted lipase
MMMTTGQKYATTARHAEHEVYYVFDAILMLYVRSLIMRVVEFCTILLQPDHHRHYVIIKKFHFDNDKIHAQIQENKRKEGKQVSEKRCARRWIAERNRKAGK